MRAGGLSAFKLSFESLVVCTGVPHKAGWWVQFLPTLRVKISTLNSKQNWEHRSWLSVEWWKSTTSQVFSSADPSSLEI